MTQAPATPELVERLRSYYPPICQEAADALEAQQARIAELEVELALLRDPDRHERFVAIALQRDASQALADRYEKALKPFAEVARHDIGEDEADADLFKPMSERYARAPLLKVGDLRRAAFSIDDAAAENGQDGEPDEVLVGVAASLAAAISLLERGGRKASPSDKMFEHMLSDYRGSLSRARQALSSQGRHDGVTSGFIPELPGVNAVPLPASPDGPLSDGWLDISTAPKDGTAIQARIPGHGEDNVIEWISDALDDGQGSCGAWTFSHEDQEPPPCWSDGWCWAVNEDGLRSAWPTAWKPLPSPDNTNPKAGAPEHG